MVHWRPTRRADDIRILGLAVGLSVLLCPAAIAFQAPLVDLADRAVAPPVVELTIVSPEEDAYISGDTTLSATVTPPDAASAVIFFVDGRQMCVVPAAPFECMWNAGRAITEHQIRVVATLTAGGRVVQTLRTKGVSFNDNEDVDAVQVTVTVTDGPDRYVRGLPISAFQVFED